MIRGNVPGSLRLAPVRWRPWWLRAWNRQTRPRAEHTQCKWCRFTGHPLTVLFHEIEVHKA